MCFWDAHLQAELWQWARIGLLHVAYESIFAITLVARIVAVVPRNMTPAAGMSHPSRVIGSVPGVSFFSVLLQNAW